MNGCSTLLNEYWTCCKNWWGILSKIVHRRSSTLNKFCLQRKSLNGHGTLLMCVVFLNTCSSSASLFAILHDEKCEKIRRPRQTQGGARQGIRHLTLVGLLLLLPLPLPLLLLLLLLLGLRVRLRLRLRVSKKMSGCWFLALEAVVSQPLARSLLWSRCPQAVLQGHCVSLSSSVRFQLREEEQQQQQEQQEGSMSHYVSLYKQRYKKWSKTIVFLGFQKGR